MKRSSPSTSSSSSSCVLDDPPLKHAKRPRKRANPEQCRRKPKSNASIADSANADAKNSNRRSSVYRGVTRHRWTGRFEAHLWDKSSYNSVQNKKGKQVYLGAYDCEEDAARTYDLAALKYWGPDTILNFPIENYTKEVEEMRSASKEEYLASLRRCSSGFSRGVSKYRGVAKHHHNGRWEARIGRVFGNKYLYLGTFSSQEEAAKAYDQAAIQYRGRNAVTNFDISNYIPKEQEDPETKPVIEQQPNEEQKQEPEPEPKEEEEEDQTQSPVPAALTEANETFDHSPMLAGCDHGRSDDDPWSFCLDAAGYDPPLVHHVMNDGDEDEDSKMLDLLDKKAFEDDVHLIFEDEDGSCQMEEEKLGKILFDSSPSPSSSSSVTCDLLF